MDGVLADFASAYHDVEARLFGPAASSRAGDPETEPSEPPATDGEETMGVPPRNRQPAS